MKDSVCKFDFLPVNVELVQKLLKGLNSEKPSELDNLDGKPLQLASGCISLPISHFIYFIIIHFSFKRFQI